MTIFKVWTQDRKVKKTVIANSLDALKKIAKTKLDLTEGPLTVVLEEDGSEIDEDEILLEFSSKVLLILTAEQSWQPVNEILPSGEQNNINGAATSQPTPLPTTTTQLPTNLPPQTPPPVIEGINPSREQEIGPYSDEYKDNSITEEQDSTNGYENVTDGSDIMDNQHTEDTAKEITDSADSPASEGISNKQKGKKIVEFDNEPYIIKHDKKHHGLAFVLTYGQFDDKNIERINAFPDRMEMERVLAKYGCKVMLPQQRANLTQKETIQFLDEVQKEWKEGDYDILIGSVSSHGEESAEVSLKNKERKVLRHKIICKDDKFLDTETQLVGRFDEPEGKPKLFFIQACRSRQGESGGLDGLDCGTTINVETYETETSSRTSGPGSQTVPQKGTDRADARHDRSDGEQSTQKSADPTDPRNIVNENINPKETSKTSAEQERTDSGQYIHKETEGNVKEPVTDNLSYEVMPPPCTTDSLVMFASATGQRAFSRSSGGWLFLCLQHVLLNKHVLERQNSENPMDILEMLTLVNNKMAIDFETKCGDSAPRIEQIMQKMETTKTLKMEFSEGCNSRTEIESGENIQETTERITAIEKQHLMPTTNAEITEKIHSTVMGHFETKRNEALNQCVVQNQDETTVVEMSMTCESKSMEIMAERKNNVAMQMEINPNYVNGLKAVSSICHMLLKDLIIKPYKGRKQSE